MSLGLLGRRRVNRARRGSGPSVRDCRSRSAPVIFPIGPNANVRSRLASGAVLASHHDAAAPATMATVTNTPERASATADISVLHVHDTFDDQNTDDLQH